MWRKTDNPSVLTVAAGGKDRVESCKGRKDKQLPAKRRTAECGTDQDGGHHIQRQPDTGGSLAGHQPPDPLQENGHVRDYQGTGLKGPDNNIQDSFPFHQRKIEPVLPAAFSTLFSWQFSLRLAPGKIAAKRMRRQSRFDLKDDYRGKLRPT